MEREATPTRSVPLPMVEEEEEEEGEEGEAEEEEAGGGGEMWWPWLLIKGEIKYTCVLHENSK